MYVDGWILSKLVYNSVTDTSTTTGQAIATMTSRISVLEKGKFITIGFLKPSTTWQRTQATSAHHALTMAAQYVAQHVLGYPNTFAIRIGRAVLRFPGCSVADYSILVAWKSSHTNADFF